MSEKITPELIRAQGAQLRRLALSEARAAELAEDVARANDAVIDSADAMLDCNDEPAQFEARLAAHRETGGGRK